VRRNHDETNASPDFVWEFWTNVANWATLQQSLDGPFAAGTRGITRLPKQEPLHWSIGEVTPPIATTIEMTLDGASLLFKWQFDALGDGRTRLTQHVVLKGEKAEIYVSPMQAAFSRSIPDGMNKLATEMANPDSRSKTLSLLQLRSSGHRH
jgi:hypothetical protein